MVFSGVVKCRLVTYTVRGVTISRSVKSWAVRLIDRNHCDSVILHFHCQCAVKQPELAAKHSSVVQLKAADFTSESPTQCKNLSFFGAKILTIQISKKNLSCI